MSIAKEYNLPADLGDKAFVITGNFQVIEAVVVELFRLSQHVGRVDFGNTRTSGKTGKKQI